MSQRQIALEICAHSLISAQQAEIGGADRIELCMALPTGGLTPSVGCMQLVRDRISIPVHVLIRPRLGDFEYVDEEIEVMCSSIDYCRKLGMEGVVFGCLIGSNLDRSIKYLVDAAGGLDMTFHRAFDMVTDPITVVQTLIDLGIHRILTSGQAKTAWEGRQLLAALQSQYSDDIEIMPGAGISKKNIAELDRVTKCVSYHSSAKKMVRSASNLDAMEITSLDGRSMDQFETDASEVALMKQILSDLV